MRCPKGNCTTELIELAAADDTRELMGAAAETADAAVTLALPITDRAANISQGIVCVQKL
jgi:predicted ATP-binding protein involved in virulence